MENLLFKLKELIVTISIGVFAFFGFIDTSPVNPINIVEEENIFVEEVADDQEMSIKFDNEASEGDKNIQDSDLKYEDEEKKEVVQIDTPIVKEIAISEEDIEKNIPILTQKPLLPQVLLNEKTRKAVVNVYCLSKRGGFSAPLSGSGVIIDEKGVVLTNAHIAQYYLLEDYQFPGYLECVIRDGSPASAVYKAELLFFPEKWIEDNRGNIFTQSPRGTGEYDYALLRITEPVSGGRKFPEIFPALTIAYNPENIYKTVPVLAASYPAGFLEGIDIARNLWLISTISKIIEVFTFEDSPTVVPQGVDLFEIEGTISAQEGSSGGAVVDFYKGELLGIITTRTRGETTGERTLRILSVPHIVRSFKEDTGQDLEQFLKGDLEKRQKEFKENGFSVFKEMLISSFNK